MGLNHLPSGKFAANGVWLAVQVIAHNLARCPTSAVLFSALSKSERRLQPYFPGSMPLRRKRRPDLRRRTLLPNS
jgi:hypothetical protein